MADKILLTITFLKILQDMSEIRIEILAQIKVQSRWIKNLLVKFQYLGNPRNEGDSFWEVDG